MIGIEVQDEIVIRMRLFMHLQSVPSERVFVAKLDPVAPEKKANEYADSAMSTNTHS